MPSHRGFSAWIQQGDILLPEDVVRTDEERHEVTCWIPGEAGQKFSVFWEDHNSGVNTCAFITFDGLSIPGRFLLGNGVAYRSGIRTSKTTERPFIFKEIPETALSTPRSTEDPGTIIVTIKRVEILGSKSTQAPPGLPSVLGKRKVGDLCVGLGMEEVAFEQQPSTWKIGPYEEDAPPGSKPKAFVTFIFNYRSSAEPIKSLQVPTLQAVVPKPTASKPMLPIADLTQEAFSKFASEVTRKAREELLQGNPAVDDSSIASASTHNAKSPAKKKQKTALTTTMSSGVSADSKPTDLPNIPANMQLNAGIASNASMHQVSATPPMYRTYGSTPPDNTVNLNGLPSATRSVSQGALTVSGSSPALTSYPVIAPTPAPRKPSQAPRTIDIRKISKPQAMSVTPVDPVTSTSRAVSISIPMLLESSSRRPVIESKRASSWTSGPTSALGPYHGQHQFFLPANTLQSSSHINRQIPDDSGTSDESPESSSQEPFPWFTNRS